MFLEAVIHRQDGIFDGFLLVGDDARRLPVEKRRLFEDDAGNASAEADTTGFEDEEANRQASCPLFLDRQIEFVLRRIPGERHKPPLHILNHEAFGTEATGIGKRLLNFISGAGCP